MKEFGHTIHRFEHIDTTMREAAVRAQAGEAEGTVVVAGQQTAGRGRMQRAWHSPAGAGLYFSLVLRPRLPPAQLPVLTMAMGLGAARGIGDAAGVRCDLRWPNDVMLSGRKCAGILTELAADGDDVHYVIVGAGVNVGHESFPTDIEAVATSLRIETGAEFLLDRVLADILRQMQNYYRVWLERGAAAIVEAFARASSYARGKHVIVESTGQRGITAGLSPDGALLLRCDSGELVPLVAGGIRPDPDFRD